MKIVIRILMSCIVLLSLSKCKSDEPSPVTGTARFSFEAKDITSGGRVNSEEVPAFIQYSLKDNNGSILNGTIGLFPFDDHYVSEPVTLTHGSYELHQYLILNADKKVIYATPLAGSPLASLVKYPLPVTFTISADEITGVTPQVLPVEDATPSDFGYVAFGFEVVKPDGKGLLRFDYVYQPRDINSMGTQIDTYTRLKMLGAKTAGWEVVSTQEGRKTRIHYKYNAAGVITGADYYEDLNGFNKMRSIAFEYESSTNTLVAAKLYDASNSKQCDLFFQYQDGKLKKLRHENFPVATQGNYNIFIEATFHYNPAGGIKELNVYGEYRHSSSPSQFNNFQEMNRLYEYDSKESIFKSEFDLAQTICVYALNFEHDKNLLTARPLNIEIIPKLLSPNNCVKSFMKKSPDSDPEAYKRSSEHVRTLTYDSYGTATGSVNEIFFPGIGVEGIYAPPLSLLSREIITIVP